MAESARHLFGFSYHRTGQTDVWRPGGSILARLGPEQPWTGPGVRLSQRTDHIVWVDVAVEVGPDEDINDVAHACELLANAEFRRLNPQGQLVVPRLG